MKKRTLFLILGVLGAVCSMAQYTSRWEAKGGLPEWEGLKMYDEAMRLDYPDTTYDVTFYHLDVEVALDSAWIEGSVRCLFNINSVPAAAVVMSMNRSLEVVSVEGVATYEHVGDKLHLVFNNAMPAGSSGEVLITYKGKPVLAGGYKGLRYETHHDGTPVIATLSTPFVAHYWYPCKDTPSDKADSVWVDITIPDRVSSAGNSFVAVSNGMLKQVVSVNGKKRFEWRHRYPVVSYYVMMAISDYEKLEDEVTINDIVVPLDYYVFPQDIVSQQAGVQQMPSVLTHFSELFGPYPFRNEKYGMTQLGYYGAIENQTNTIINSMDFNWFITSVHELAHMWFGDMITCDDWRHGWINEGLATYSEALWAEYAGGATAYNQTMAANEYFNGGTLILPESTDTFFVFQPIIYRKGAFVLHMLRNVMGKEPFLTALKQYATKEELMYSSANTSDLKSAFEVVYGESLDWFFDQWVYDSFYPILHFNFKNVIAEDKVLVALQQVQGLMNRRELFVAPVTLRLIYEDNTFDDREVWCDKITHTYTLNIDKLVKNVVIDPENVLLEKNFFDAELPIGVDEPERLQVMVWPQPAKDWLHIKMAETTPAFVQIYDVWGVEIYHHQLQGEMVNLNDWMPGIYLLMIEQGGKRWHRKIVVG